VIIIWDHQLRCRWSYRSLVHHFISSLRSHKMGTRCVWPTFDFHMLSTVMRSFEHKFSCSLRSRKFGSHCVWPTNNLFFAIAWTYWV